MKKKHEYQTPLMETIDQVSMSSPLCTSILDVDITTLGGDLGNGLNDFEYVEW